MISFGAHPLYDDLCDQARTFGQFLGRESAYERYSRSGEPRQSLPMNYAAERSFSIPRSLVTPSVRPLPMNDGPKGIGSPTDLQSPGLPYYSLNFSIFKVNCAIDYDFYSRER